MMLDEFTWRKVLILRRNVTGIGIEEICSAQCSDL